MAHNDVSKKRRSTKVRIAKVAPVRVLLPDHVIRRIEVNRPKPKQAR